MALEAFEAAKRKNARPIQQKAALTGLQFKQILTYFSGANASFGELRLAAMVICGFLGFLRADEIINLRVRNLAFENDCAILHITKAKNDQMKKGNEVKIAQVGGALCPVNILHRYLETFRSSQLTLEIDFPLFPTLKASKGNIRAICKPISYDRLRNEFKGAIQKLGLKADLFGTHSMRRGGATAAAIGKVPGRVLQKQGRWRSAAVKNRYIEQAHEEQLLVSSVILQNLSQL